MQDQDAFNKQMTKAIELLGKSIDTLGECAEHDEYDADDLMNTIDELNIILDLLLSRD